LLAAGCSTRFVWVNEVNNYGDKGPYILLKNNTENKADAIFQCIFVSVTGTSYEKKFVFYSMEPWEEHKLYADYKLGEIKRVICRDIKTQIHEQ
jgi:hypothetical protein